MRLSLETLQHLLRQLWVSARILLRAFRRLLPDPSNEEESAVHREFFVDASWDTSYVVLTISSCAIASFGLISNSAAVIIGAMIIAPLMLPLRALAFAALEGDLGLFRKSLISIAGATLLALALSCSIGLVAGIPEFKSEVLSRTQPNLVDLGIAIVAGGLSGFAKVEPRLSDALAGTAIAVALMPPLCVVGLSFSQGIWAFSWGAFLLYCTNLLGITLACMVIFIVMGYTEMTQALGVAFVMTLALFLPLGSSFLQLVRQTELQAAINDILVRRTVTVGQPEVELVNTNVIWTEDPPVVYLSVRTATKITPKQVKLVQQFINRELEREFTLIFLVGEVTEVRAQGEEAPEKRLPQPEGP